ncbi:MAG: hypothetical protein IT373_09705 [Polyangiaceae bacterium]|nr:hypothetical protein [Polyangiaceae bacterium]
MSGPGSTTRRLGRVVAVGVAPALLLALAGAEACKVRSARSAGGDGDYPCESAADCPQPETPCLVAQCSEGQCVHTYAPPGFLPAGEQKPGDCVAVFCDGGGNAIARSAPRDTPPDDGLPCTVEACEAGQPARSPAPAGQPCAVGPESNGVLDGLCNGHGSCGVCLPEAKRCEGQGVQTCNAEGKWGAPVLCAATTPVCRTDHCIGIAELAVGRHHGCLRLEDSTVWCWGDDSQGQLVSDATAGQAPDWAGRLKAAGFGLRHGCAQRLDGGLACWGSNNYGELGTGNFDGSDVPVEAGVKGVAELAVGAMHSCVLASGNVLCWGLNERGQLGAGKPSADRTGAMSELSSGSAAAQRPTEAKDVKASGLGLFGDTTCLRGPRGLECWGAPSYYPDEPLSDPAETKLRDALAHSAPLQVKGLSGVTSVAAGAEFSCAVTGAGAAMCWGANDVGQLGDGTTTDRHAPVAVTGLSGVQRIGLGDRHGCALVAGGKVYCWGAGENGELGDGQSTSSSTPVAVASLGRVRQLSVGADFACVRLEGSGAIACWGANDAGQLGNGSTDAAPTPVPLAF